MEEFRLLPVRTSTGRVVKQKKFDDLIKLGVSHEDAMNIVLGKRKRNWADKMTYMSPVFYRGYGSQNRGIIQELKAPGQRNPKIRERIIHLTGSDHNKNDMVKKESTTTLKSVLELMKNQDDQDVEVFKDDTTINTFDLDSIITDQFADLDWNDPELD